MYNDTRKIPSLHESAPSLEKIDTNKRNFLSENTWGGRREKKGFYEKRNYIIDQVDF
jgi:hypothetical protein